MAEDEEEVCNDETSSKFHPQPDQRSKDPDPDKLELLVKARGRVLARLRHLLDSARPVDVARSK